MAEPNDKTLVKKLKEIVLDTDPEGIFRDARAAGLEVTKVEDFRHQAHNYWRIEDLMRQYARRAARFSAASGATSGVGGAPTAVALGGVDMANMAAQLYWLCQRLHPQWLRSWESAATRKSDRNLPPCPRLRYGGTSSVEAATCSCRKQGRETMGPQQLYPQADNPCSRKTRSQNHHQASRQIHPGCRWRLRSDAQLRLC